MYGRIEEDNIVHDHLNQPTGWKMQGEKISVDVWVHSEVEQSASLVLTRHIDSGMWGVWESNWKEYWRNVSFVKGFDDEQQAKAFLWDRLQYLTSQVAVIRTMLLDRTNNMYGEMDGEKTEEVPTRPNPNEWMHGKCMMCGKKTKIHTGFGECEGCIVDASKE